MSSGSSWENQVALPQYYDTWVIFDVEEWRVIAKDEELQQDNGWHPQEWNPPEPWIRFQSTETIGCVQEAPGLFGMGSDVH